MVFRFHICSCCTILILEEMFWFHDQNHFVCRGYTPSYIFHQLSMHHSFTKRKNKNITRLKASPKHCIQFVILCVLILIPTTSKMEGFCLTTLLSSCQQTKTVVLHKQTSSQKKKYKIKIMRCS
ncbi:hypothetical protein K450DRAFT_230997 [Umbelopsis ramanniana AG]|uniref:Uncharacterized protein n=1 Tax=Umbelopsis ramanniana AG TaxID=1314678 RepID=A0AAD5HEU6_UMBRA|nr:uncharacterized protein K450DRAFT_230997 [Umbelopsis ramanniana AG]KAI8581760.1 hypothetical protein K450DRAFT_230997 [Umbelopsis ramanniana AG]